MVQGVTRETSSFTKSHTTFSGADITLFMNGSRMTKAQSISYSITREKAPIYVLGSADPLCFSRGKRGIAGSLIFSSNAYDALGEILDASEYAAKDTDLAHYFATNENASIADYVNDGGIRGNAPESTASVMAAAPTYYDQLLPFDVIIMAANEYFQTAQMIIYGIEFLTTGSGLSIDDTSNESQMSYVAQSITRWQISDRPNSAFDFDQVIGFNPVAAASTFGTSGFGTT